MSVELISVCLVESVVSVPLAVALFQQSGGHLVNPGSLPDMNIAHLAFPLPPATYTSGRNRKERNFESLKQSMWGEQVK